MQERAHLTLRLQLSNPYEGPRFPGSSDSILYLHKFLSVSTAAAPEFNRSLDTRSFMRMVSLS
jgi:hypothetical protein